MFDDNKLYTVLEVRKATGLHRATIWDHLLQGKLKGKKVLAQGKGGAWRMEGADLNEWQKKYNIVPKTP